MFEQVVVNQWKVLLGECCVEQNKVLYVFSGCLLFFGELVEVVVGFEVLVCDKLLLKKFEQFCYIGKDVVCVIDGVDIVNGCVGFGFDVCFDDMFYVVVVWLFVYGGKFKCYDVVVVLKVLGVVKVIEIEGWLILFEFQLLGGVVVVVQNIWVVIKGCEVLVVEWDVGVNGGYDLVVYCK